MSRDENDTRETTFEMDSRMNRQMSARISALMDGELEGHELDDALRSLRKEESLRREWGDYHRIGAALRRELSPDVDIAARVMSALDREPTVLAPARRSSVVERIRPLAAFAASAAGVVLVAWVALGDPAVRNPVFPGGIPSLAAAPAAPRPVAAPDSTPQTARMQEYLLAHHAHGPASSVAGGTRYVRTVAMDRDGR